MRSSDMYKIKIFITKVYFNSTYLYQKDSNKMKNAGVVYISIICSILFSQKVILAQMVGANAYLKGVYMEIGVNGGGGYEGVDTLVSAPPAGMHIRGGGSTFLGIVGNPQKNSWSTFDGDFFVPGTPENGWGFEIGTIGGISQNNNCAGPVNTFGAITSYMNTGGYISADWEGDCASSGTDLHFKISYNLQDTALFYTTTVSITNNNSAAIADMYYYKNIDPDNNVSISFDYTTQNSIISQPSGGSGMACVTAISNVPWYSHLALIGLGNDWRACYGGFSNRDASDLWNGSGAGFVQTTGATNFQDEAIALAYRIQNFLPGTTRVFKYLTVIDTNSIEDALLSTFFLDFLGEDNGSSYVTDTVKICGADSVAINVSGPDVSDYLWSWSPSSGLSDSTGVSVLALPAVQTTYTVVGTPVSGSGSSVTLLLVAKPVAAGPIAAFSPISAMCENASSIVLSGGSPSGGIYSGYGIMNDSIFSPSVAGDGSFLITYTVADSNGCYASDTSTILVYDVQVVLWNSGTICDNADPLVLTAGVPPGGIYSGGSGIVNDSTFDPSVVVAPGAFFIVYTYTYSNGCSASDTNMIYVDDCTGIDDHNSTNSVNVYPNPFSTDALIVIGSSIQLKSAVLHVYDLLGKEVMAVLEIQDHEFKIERNKLFSGMYIYKLENDSQVIGTGKLMIR